MNVIDFEKKIKNKRQGAFVIFYALDGYPWSKYPEDKSGRQALKIPTCLMINRADGTIGFIGGKVEEGESLEEAAIREVSQEIGHKILLTLEPIVAHDIGKITTHAFAAQMSYDQLRNIQDDAVHAEHFGSEVTGIFLPHLIDYKKSVGKNGGIVNLIRSSLAPSVREELVHFLLKKEIFSEHELTDICLQADFSLDRLLL